MFSLFHLCKNAESTLIWNNEFCWCYWANKVKKHDTPNLGNQFVEEQNKYPWCHRDFLFDVGYHRHMEITFCPALTKLALDLHVKTCMHVCGMNFQSFFRLLIGWYIGFWQWFWHPTSPTLASNATLKIFISGVSSPILIL